MKQGSSAELPDTLLWSGDFGGGDHFLIGDDKDVREQKPYIDDLDLLLTATTNAHQPNNTLAELKPLPPFTGYTGHLSINGISGHHYHTIASAPTSTRVEANNNTADTTNQNVYFSPDQVVSSSTMDSTIDHIKTENCLDYLPSDMDDTIAAIIGSAMADTTVQSQDGEDSRDSWLDLDAWISGNYSSSPKACSDTLQDFLPSSPPFPSLSYQQQMKPQFGHMPLLQNRLQNGPPKEEVPYLECTSPSSSTYLAHSPPCHVVSTSDMAFIPHSSRPSPELQVSFPHTTTPCKKSRNRAKSKAGIIYSDGNLGKEKTVHRCNICNRGFLNKSNIKVHLRTHTGEKPFRCEVCGKAFRQKAHLIKHAQIHKRVGRD